MKSVFQKIHANNRTQAAVWALKHGMTPVNDAV
jgi:DNA-binding NarL/FixJ family response regulator